MGLRDALKAALMEPPPGSGGMMDLYYQFKELPPRYQQMVINAGKRVYGKWVKDGRPPV